MGRVVSVMAWGEVMTMDTAAIWTRVSGHFRPVFLSGVLLLVPVVITYLVFRWVFNLLDGILAPAITGVSGARIPGLGLVALVALIYLVGLAWRNAVGRQWITFAHRKLLQIPIVSSIYGPSRQLIESFAGSDESCGFRQVVAIEYPGKGSWMVGFLTGYTTVGGGASMGIVYVPTAPTPNSGWVTLVPTDAIYDTGMSVKQALTMVLSGGIASPTHIGKTPIPTPVPGVRLAASEAGIFSTPVAPTGTPERAQPEVRSAY